MEELNEEELKGAKGGACPISTYSCSIIKDSGSSNRLWLRAGGKVVKLWVKEISYNKRIIQIGETAPLMRDNRWRIIAVLGCTIRIQFRDKGLINVMASKSGFDYIKLRYELANKFKIEKKFYFGR